VSAHVVAVSSSAKHSFSKASATSVTLLEGLGVEGDAHAGVYDRHRSHARYNPRQPNLRQVHLLQGELLEELEVTPGALGENVTTHGVDLLALSAGTRIHLGADAVVELTGLRNPCVQIDRYREGLLKRVVGRDDEGTTILRAGVMSVVLQGGIVRAGDVVRVVVPEVFVPLQRV
jgi:MOSC domain-containing protein YiiM